MVRVFSTKDAEFTSEFRSFLAEPRGNASDTRDVVTEILGAVQAQALHAHQMSHRQGPAVPAMAHSHHAAAL